MKINAITPIRVIWIMSLLICCPMMSLATLPSEEDVPKMTEPVSRLEPKITAPVDEKSQSTQPQTALQKPQQTFRDCSSCPEMVRLPNGTAMGKFEITQGEWQAIMGNNPSYFAGCGDRCPVEQVSWDEVLTFIRLLNKQTGKQYRLPTEEEWYSACQAGAGNVYCGSDDIDAVAWYAGNSGGANHIVGQKQANAWDLYDMSGNVFEWTGSCYKEDCSSRVGRGGSWAYKPVNLRSDYRFGFAPSYHGGNLGFRLVRDG